MASNGKYVRAKYDETHSSDGELERERNACCTSEDESNCYKNVVDQVNSECETSDDGENDSEQNSTDTSESSHSLNGGEPIDPTNEETASMNSEPQISTGTPSEKESNGTGDRMQQIEKVVRFDEGHSPLRIKQ